MADDVPRGINAAARASCTAGAERTTGAGIRRGVSLLPSLFTLANLFCGWACVVYAMRGELATAAPFIGIAIVLDMLDGRIARMTGTTSEFGVQLDSLADLISFGMAPAVLAFQWGLAAARPARVGGRVPVRHRRRAAPGALQHPDAHTDKRYFVGLAEPGRRRDRRVDGVLFPDGLHDLPAGAAWRVRAGPRPGAADGQHHPLPQLQDDRPRHASAATAG